MLHGSYETSVKKYGISDEEEGCRISPGSRAAGNRTQSSRTRIVRTTGILQPVSIYT
jgi:hypothetical protein